MTARYKNVTMPPGVEQRYHKKFITITNVLKNSTGLSIGENFKTGAISKQTQTRKSDLDIGFLLPNGYSVATVLEKV